MNKIDFYFDFLSPFSFFAWKNLQSGSLGTEVQIHYYPVILGSILNHHGMKGPGEIDPKREYLYKNCLRYAKRKGWNFLCPKTHPFNPLYALRLATLECSGTLQTKVIDCFWKAGWEEGIDLGSPEELEVALRNAGLPAKELMDQCYEKSVKNAVKENTNRAIAVGSFGVPTLLVNESEMFWGNDSLEDVKRYLDGEDDLDRELYLKILAKTPRKIISIT
ncbi:MAG: 2-hydroxychromene-2-carboxylate isomerase [Bacteriovoracaceae bacterium]